MELKKFIIKGLFGSLNHTIKFPTPTNQGTHPSLVILYGKNGVGKTTVLRMIDGLMHLDFNVFRTMPFAFCSLTFTTGDSISVRPLLKKRNLVAIEVTFRNIKVQLHPLTPGPLNEADSPNVEIFRDTFFSLTDTINFEFIDTERLRELQQPIREQREIDLIEHERTIAPKVILQAKQLNPKAKARIKTASLASRVAKFISDAQINYRTFFSTTGPDLFPRIIERLTSTQATKYNISDLRQRLSKIHDQDQITERLGLESDRWDYKQLMGQIQRLANRRGVARQQALTVLDSYVEMLESRAAERALVAARLQTFERLISEFFVNKRVFVDPNEGLKIMTEADKRLKEYQLSSGEFHFLFLMVAALVTRRRGTVIAIDEPEMSMHIAWQRQLISALFECTSGAEPLFIFATHSPDIVSSYPDSKVELKLSGQ